jgi:hypothetical protein
MSQGSRLVVAHGFLLATLGWHGCTRDLTATGSAATDVIAGQPAKEHLLESIRILREARFIEMSGTASRPLDKVDKPIAFHLLMGPGAKVAFRCGRIAGYYDGMHFTCVDHNTSPPTRSVIGEGAGLADGVYMALQYGLHGPFPIAYARLVDEATWLAEVITNDDQAVFEERHLPGNKVEFRVRDHLGAEDRFVFAGSRMLPKSCAWYSGDSQGKPYYLRTIKRVRFPTSVPDRAFTAP